MIIDIITLFDGMCETVLSESIIGRARRRGDIEIECVNLREFGEGRHRQVDDRPYGGGYGMLMKAEPIFRCYEHQVHKRGMTPYVIYLSPRGRTLHHGVVKELAEKEYLLLLCGHYEGVDERALELIGADYLSIGDYVLTGGELPAMVMIDCISRLVPGVLNNDISAEIESFSDNLLEYPQYTRPEEFRGLKVPEVLLSGHHKNIETWRRQQSIRRTLERRPDLLEDAVLSKKEKIFLEQLLREKEEQ